MNRKLRFVLLLSIPLVLAGLFVYGREFEVKRGSELGKEKPAVSESGEPGIVRFDARSLALAKLDIVAVRRANVPLVLKLPGTVEINPAASVKVTPRVPGKIESLLVNVGTQVERGQPLAALSSTELAQSQAAFRQAAARLQVAQVNLQRQRQLATLGSFSRPTLDAARTQFSTVQSELAGAQSDIAHADATLRQARSQAALAVSRFERATHGLQDQLVSRQDWEQARADVERAQADVTAAVGTLEAAHTRERGARERMAVAAQALHREESIYHGGYATSRELVAAQAAVDQARLDAQAATEAIHLLGGAPGDTDTTPVVSPIRGQVTERTVSLGETVSPSQALFTVVDTSMVWITVDVFPADIPDVRVGVPLQVVSESAIGTTFSGHISYVAPLTDPSTRTVKARCVIANPHGLLRPGAFVTGQLTGLRRKNALLVPADAVQRLDQRIVVFTPADKPGEFRVQPVEVGDTVSGNTEIRMGLRAGERVVGRGAFLIKAQALKGESAEDEERERR